MQTTKHIHGNEIFFTSMSRQTLETIETWCYIEIGELQNSDEVKAFE